MTHSRTCKQGRQPCPSPWACETGCKSNVVEIRRESPRDRAAAKFWDIELQDSGNPGYPFTFLDAPGNLWDSLKWWQLLGLACAIVFACCLVAAVVVPK